MSRLQRLLLLTIKEKRIMSSSELLPWRIAFIHKNWDITFILYLLSKPIVRGNITDKTYTILSEDPETISKVMNDFTFALPKYKRLPIDGGAVE